MNIKVNENRLIDFSEHEQGTSNEINVQKLQIEVPEKYNDFFKKIVFVTDDGTFWDHLEEDGSYALKNNVTKYSNVEFYIWLSKTENEVTEDFRSKTYPLFFNENVSPDGEVPEEQETEMERIIRILEEEITKVKNLENDVQQLKDDLEDLVEEAERVDIDGNKVDKTATITLTRRTGEVKTIQISDGVSLQFMWDGTSLGIKTDNDENYTFVNLQGIQGPVGPQGEAFQIKKTYSSVAEMNADFDNMEIGDYVMIASSVEVKDNAKLYTKGEEAWIFITDFSGATRNPTDRLELRQTFKLEQ